MMIETLLGMARYLAPRNDDDQIDRMHYLYTPNILLAFSVLISFKQFGGRPLECMFPNKFPGSWEQYAENYCWAQNTYFVSPSEHVALIKAEDRYTPERKLSYYQWVPFFILLQAACFRLPSIFWNYLSRHSGIRIHEIVKLAMMPENIDVEVKKRNVSILTRHMQNALRFQRRVDRKQLEAYKTCKCLNWPYSAYFMTSMYLFTKGLYLINVIIQLYAMNRFLETDKHAWYGLEVIRDLLAGVEWGTSGFFPRVSLCDFTVRQVANIQRYSVQCVLVINIFNEKLFIFMWFWYMLLFVATIVSFLYWFVLMCAPFCNRWFIAQHLELSELAFDPKSEKKLVDKFLNNYLRSDGVFVLRMVTMHAGIIFGTDLVAALWEAFYGIENQVGIEIKRPIIPPSPVWDVKFTSSQGSIILPILGRVIQAKKENEENLKSNIESALRHRKKKRNKQVGLEMGENDRIVAHLLPSGDAGNRSGSSSDEAPPANRDPPKL